MEVPNGWLQVIRGPRLRSEKWPMQSDRGARPAASTKSPPTNQGRTMEETRATRMFSHSSEQGGPRRAGHSSWARGFVATCQGGSEEARCATAIFPFARFRRGSSSRESCQVGESSGGSRGHYRSRGRCNQERSRQSTRCGTRDPWENRLRSARDSSNVPRNGCSSWTQKELPKVHCWSKAEHVLFGWRQKQHSNRQCRHLQHRWPFPSWKRNSPVPGQSWQPHTQRHQEINQRKKPTAQRFRPQHSRGGRVVAEVQEMEDAISSGSTVDVARLATAIAEEATQLRVWTQPPPTLNGSDLFRPIPL